MMSCQNSTRRRTKPGTNWSPSAPAFHTGASHGIRRSGRCMESQVTSATDGHTPEVAGRAPVCAHLHSPTSREGVGRRTGRTYVWRQSRFWSQPSVTTYSATWRKGRKETYMQQYCHSSVTCRYLYSYDTCERKNVREILARLFQHRAFCTELVASSTADSCYTYGQWRPVRRPPCHRAACFDPCSLSHKRKASEIIRRLVGWQPTREGV